MYEPLKRLALAVLKVPSEPPEEPAGTHESVVVFRASPRYLTYLMIPMIVSVMSLGIGLGMGEGIIGFALFKKGFLGVAVAVWAVGALLILLKAVTFYVVTRLNYELRWYLVTDRSLRIREGVWLTREVTLTFANVQNINVIQGPLQRWFGISDLIVETAGGGTGKAAGGPNMMLSHHGVLRGIENATEVRDRIQNLLRAYRASGLGDPEERHAAPAAASAGFDGEALEVLRGIRDEARRLRAAASAAP